MKARPQTDDVVTDTGCHGWECYCYRAWDNVFNAINTAVNESALYPELAEAMLCDAYPTTDDPFMQQLEQTMRHTLREMVKRQTATHNLNAKAYRATIDEPQTTIEIARDMKEAERLAAQMLEMG